MIIYETYSTVAAMPFEYEKKKLVLQYAVSKVKMTVTKL